jgi:hypothetical protein
MYDLEQRRLIDAEITRRSIAFHGTPGPGKEAVFRLRDTDAAASADAAEPGIRRPRRHDRDFRQRQ